MKKWMLLILVGMASMLAAGGTVLAQSTVDEATATQAIKLGEAAAERGDNTAALAHFERATANREVGPLAWLNIAFIKENAGDYEAAVQAFLRAADSFDHFVARETAIERLNQYGAELLKQKNYAVAEQLFAKGAFLQRTQSLHGLTIALLEQGKASEAEDAAERLVTRNPMRVANYQLWYHAVTRRADALAQDPKNAEFVEWLREEAKEIEAKAKALPLLVDNLELVRESGRVILRTTLIGNSAPAGHRCMVDFVLNGSPAMAAGATFTAPAPGAKLTIDALAPKAEVDQEFIDISYTIAHCEAPGAATATPPTAKSASFEACPKNMLEVNALFEGRESYATHVDSYGKDDFAYPAGGIKIFNKQITRFVANEGTSGSFVLFEFGLPGSFRDYSTRFKKIYADRDPNCGDNYCSALSRTERLASARLVEKVLPEGMLDKGVYLACLYQ